MSADGQDVAILLGLFRQSLYGATDLGETQSCLRFLCFVVFEQPFGVGSWRISSQPFCLFATQDAWQDGRLRQCFVQGQDVCQAHAGLDSQG